MVNLNWDVHGKDLKLPNILLVLADDMGYSDLGCYGSEISTPNIDLLAANGLRYTQFYNTARCWPTRAALLTGYYAQQVRRDALPSIGRRGQGQRPAWAQLLPELLKPHGYRSYHSGKWHIDGEPTTSGFEHSYRLDDHDRFFTAKRHSLDSKKLPEKKLDDNYYATTAITDYTIEFLEEHQQQHPEKPFFQFVAFTSPHFPLHATAEDIASYAGKYNVGWDNIRATRWQRMQQLRIVSGRLSALEPQIGTPYTHHYENAALQLGSVEVNAEMPWDKLTTDQQEFQASKMEIHAAMIDRMDRNVGRIVKHLRDSGEIENTLIFVLSDNGASAEIMIRGDGHDTTAAPGSASSYLCLGAGWSSAANTPFRRHKTWVHEGGISTPLVIHWPNGIRNTGTLRHAVGHVIDIVPTILQIIGASWPSNHPSKHQPPPPGKSLVASFERDQPINRNSIWWLHEGNRAIRVGDSKLVAASGQPWELYDLKQDRSESHDLAEVRPDKVYELAKMWDQQVLDIAQQEETNVNNRPHTPKAE